MNMKWIKSNQKFSHKAELDRHVRSFLYKRKAALSEGTLKVLKVIWRHAVKYPGVAFLKKQTLANKTDLSTRTVTRAVNKLVNEGLIEKVTTKKPNGRQGVNLIIFLPQADLFLPEDVTPHVTPDVTPQTSNKSSSDKLKPLKSTTETKKKQRKASFSNFDSIDHTFLPSFIPVSFIEVTKPFLNPGEVLNAWRTVESAYRQAALKWPVEDYLSVITETFKRSVFAYKSGMVRKELLAYYYGGLVQSFKEVVRKEVIEDRQTLYYDWLNE
ncbi:helix-turn-helix domain-containing protein [Halobacillus sp. BBL2006]|uniref:helix-turn-helix domain-containing protein n=1 Tax=Halobacillus sp. BBL2006 TaxID=1543706 RepID=UPI00068C8AE4|nr:helix-turn-helix domain-containing protein [Halobacillus sp. BBL2006]